MDRTTSTFPSILPAPSKENNTSKERCLNGVGVGKEFPLIGRHRAPAACTSCRKKKIKCFAERPNCRQCLKLGTQCIYETVGSETPGEARQRRLGQLQDRSSYYRELYHILKTRPDQDIAAIVARIRQGAEVEQVIRFVKEGDSLIQLSVAPDTSNYRYDTSSFPKIIPDFPRRNPRIPRVDPLLVRGTMGIGDGGNSSSSTVPRTELGYLDDNIIEPRKFY